MEFLIRFEINIIKNVVAFISKNEPLVKLTLGSIAAVGPDTCSSRKARSLECGAIEISTPYQLKMSSLESTNEKLMSEN